MMIAVNKITNNRKISHWISKDNRYQSDNMVSKDKTRNIRSVEYNQCAQGCAVKCEQIMKQWQMAFIDWNHCETLSYIVFI